MPYRTTLSLVLLLALTSGASTTLAQQGYFHVEQRQGVWWIIEPSGQPTLSIGVDHIAYEADRIKGTGPCPYAEVLDKIYPDRHAWGLMTLARIRLWGFNTIGAWSDAELWTLGAPYTIILDIAQQAGADWLHGKPADVFSPRFEEAARAIAGKVCQPRRDDRALLGYFSDNELRWGQDWRGKETMLDMYLALPPEAAGHAAAIAFLKERYANDISKLNVAWGIQARDFESLPSGGATDVYKNDAEEFLSRVANRYFQVCAEAIHAVDPNHMYLGARFAGKSPDVVFRAAKAADIVSINIYAMDPRPLVRRVHELSGRPVIIGEFAFRAQDSGLPNTRGAGPRVANQQERAKAYRDYVTWLESLPEAVGYHWFEWVDEPKEGRFDGEDSNYGLVDIADKPYAEFVEAAKAANAEALAAHKKAAP